MRVFNLRLGLVGTATIAVMAWVASPAMATPLPNDVNGHTHAGVDADPHRCGTYVRGAEANGFQTNPAGYEFVIGSPMGNAAGNAIDHHWVQDAGNPGALVWDMGLPTASVDVFPSIDHGPVPEEAIESTAYGTNDLSAPESTWEAGDITTVFDQGFDAAWISDDFATRWQFSQPYKYVGIHFGGPKALQDDNDAEIDAVCAETTPPTCVFRTSVAGPPKKILIDVGDTGSGLASIVVTSSANLTPAGTVTVSPVLVPGSTAPTLVTATKDNQALGSQVSLRVTDMAGNFVDCDPTDITLTRERGRPVSVTLSGLPQAEHLLAVINGTPGLDALQVMVNGRTVSVIAQRDGRTTTVDLASAMRPGNGNTVVFTAYGRPGGTAMAVLHD